MNAKSLLLTTIVPVIGLALLSLPAGAECWMTCPPGSTTTPSATGEQGTAATAEPAASPEEVTPAKKTQATAKASPTRVPAKPTAAPTPVGATAEPATALEEPTPAKEPETTAKVSPTQVPAKPKAAPDFRLGQVPPGSLYTFSPRRQHQRRTQLRKRWLDLHRFRNPLRQTRRSNRIRLRQRHQPLFQFQA